MSAYTLGTKGADLKSFHCTRHITIFYFRIHELRYITVRPVPRKYAVGHHCKKYIDNFSLSKFGICVHANAKFTK